MQKANKNNKKQRKLRKAQEKKRNFKTKLTDIDLQYEVVFFLS